MDDNGEYEDIEEYEDMGIRDYQIDDLKHELNYLWGYDLKLEFLKKIKKELKILTNAYENDKIHFDLSNDYSFTTDTKCEELKTDITVHIDLAVYIGGEHVTEETVREYISGRARYFRRTLDWITNEIILLKKNRKKITIDGKIWIQA